MASYQRESLYQERTHRQNITEQINLVFFFTEAIQLKCDGTLWRTGWGSEGETGEWSG